MSKTLIDLDAVRDLLQAPFAPQRGIDHDVACDLVAEIERLTAERNALLEPDAIFPPLDRPKPSVDILDDAASIIHSAQALEAGAEEAGFERDAYVVRRVRILAEALLAEVERLTLAPETVALMRAASGEYIDNLKLAVAADEWFAAGCPNLPNYGEE